MSNMRLMKYWTNQGEDMAYAIVEPSQATNAHPLVHFQHEYWSVPVTGMSIESLKKLLRDMLKACDGEVLLLEPERITQAKVTPEKAEVANA